MPDRTKLQPGDRIRLLRVPPFDLDQRTRERRAGLPDAGITATTLERILAQDPLVTISRIDEYGLPWFDYHLQTPDGQVEYHTLAIMDDDSWCLA